MTRRLARDDANSAMSRIIIRELRQTRQESSMNLIGPPGDLHPTFKEPLDVLGEYSAADYSAAVALQRTWRQRMAYIYVKELKQQRHCYQRREEMRAGLHVDCAACTSAGDRSAELKSRNQKKAWRDTDDLLFKGMARVQMSDRGDNWNERWQEALSLPNITNMDKTHRRSSLDAVYSDFVHTAVTYGRTIISEYFLHEYMKSVKPKQLGGVAGGKKYLWRGILFKLADGSQGPYGGSDEAAAKAAGHELRGACEYLKTGVGLCVPPMCLLDYKGFRMLAQAQLPLGETSLKMGTPDGGRTVFNDSPNLERATSQAADTLGLRAHTVGGKLRMEPYIEAGSTNVSWRKVNVGGHVLNAAADVEGHEGADSRMYLLDLARAFPPEDPNATPHLSGMLSVSAKAVVRREGKKDVATTVTKAHATLVDYDIQYADGRMEQGTPAHLLRDLRLFIFYRLMRPEFVKDRGRRVLRKVKLPPDHKFPRVMVTNPMMFAIKYSREALAQTPSSSTTRSKQRYSAGSSAVVPSEAPPRASTRGRYGDREDASLGSKPLSSVAETRLLTPDVDEDGRRYATFGGNKEDGDGVYGEAVGQESRGGGDAGAEVAAHENWKRRAMECGIEFVDSGDKYYEGFRRSEVEEDEEELKRRGGICYRPFHEAPVEEEAQGYDVMAGDLGEEDRGIGEVGVGFVGGERGRQPFPRGAPEDDDDFSAAGDKEGGRDADNEGVVPEVERRFARVGMFRRESTSFKPDDMGDDVPPRGGVAGGPTSSVWHNSGALMSNIDTASDESGDVAGTVAEVKERASAGLWGRGKEESRGETGDFNYNWFDTGSLASPMMSSVTGGGSRREGASERYWGATSGNAASSPSNSGLNARVSPRQQHSRSSSWSKQQQQMRSRSQQQQQQQQVPSAGPAPAVATTTAVAPREPRPGLGVGTYDKFSNTSFLSQASMDDHLPGSPRDSSRIMQGGANALMSDDDGGSTDVSDAAVEAAVATMEMEVNSAVAVEDREAYQAAGAGYDTMSIRSLASHGSFGSVSDLGPPSGKLTDSHAAGRAALNQGGVDGYVDFVPAPHGGGYSNGAWRETSLAPVLAPPAATSGGKKSKPAAEDLLADRENFGRGSSSGGGDGRLGSGTGYAQVTAHMKGDSDAGGYALPPQGLDGLAYDEFMARSDRSVASSDCHGAKKYGMMDLQPPQISHASVLVPPEPKMPTEMVPSFFPLQPQTQKKYGGDMSLATRAAGNSSGNHSAVPHAMAVEKRLAMEEKRMAAEEERLAMAEKRFATDKRSSMEKRLATEKRAATDTRAVADGRPVPLSPDALTAFANGDPDAKEWNKDVTEATQFLLTVLVPSTAHLLCSIPPAKLAKVHLATEMHKCGVNMRHLGLLRAYVAPHRTLIKQQQRQHVNNTCATGGNSSSSSPSGGDPADSVVETSGVLVGGDGFFTAAARGDVDSKGDGRRSSSKRKTTSRGGSGTEWFLGKATSSTAIIRDRVLVEVVVRTLKLVLREFQRRWMKSEQSTSEQGMHLLVAQFLNLVTGHHARSDLFWREDVTVGVCQRFGTVALTDSERAGLWAACSERPELLRMIVKELVKVTGVRFKESVNQRLRNRHLSVVGFKFDLTDIRDIEAVVTPMSVFP